MNIEKLYDILEFNKDNIASIFAVNKYDDWTLVDNVKKIKIRDYDHLSLSFVFDSCKELCDFLSNILRLHNIRLGIDGVQYYFYDGDESPPPICFRLILVVVIDEEWW